MANEITKLLDVVTPEVFNTYMNNFTEEKSALIQSGVAVSILAYQLILHQVVCWLICHSGMI